MPGAGKKERRSGARSIGGRVRAAVARARPGPKKASTPAKTSKAAKPAPKAAKRPAPKKPAGKSAKPAGKAKKPTPAKAQKKAPAKKAVPKKGVPKKAVAKKASAKAPAKATAKAARPAAKSTATAKAAPATATGRTATGTKAATPLAVTRALAGETKPKSGKKTVTCPLSGFEVTPGPANLSPKTLERLRQKLIDEKDRLRHQAEELSAEAEQLAREREAGDTQFDEESGEGDTVNIERERDLLLSATARQVVEEIDDALDRIKRNKYGVCKPAGRKIAVERLEAIPWAQVCVDCKARAERRR